VEVFRGATYILCGADRFVGGGLEAFLLVHGPEAPEHGYEGDEHTEGGVEDHVGLPLVAHVAGGGDLHETEKVPGNEIHPSVGEVHGEGWFDVCLDQIQLLLKCVKLRVLLHS
jgi:hypothetical protein